MFSCAVLQGQHQPKRHRTGWRRQGAARRPRLLQRSVRRRPFIRGGSAGPSAASSRRIAGAWISRRATRGTTQRLRRDLDQPGARARGAYGPVRRAVQRADGWPASRDTPTMARPTFKIVLRRRSANAARSAARRILASQDAASQHDAPARREHVSPKCLVSRNDTLDDGLSGGAAPRARARPARARCGSADAEERCPADNPTA